jgi:chromosome partitioning protein
MGLLQRFARPEFRPGQEAQSPPEDERREQAPADERAETSAPPPGAEQGGRSVHESQAISQEEPREDSPQAAVSSEAEPSAQRSPARPTSAAFPRAEQPSPQPEVKRAEVIAFANQKGGVAKTTTTLNLAVAFAETGHRVLAVDMDPQGNLTMSQGIDPDSVERSMYDVLVNDHSIRDVVRKREVDVACASIDLAGAEIAMSTKIGRERSLEKALRAVREDYDFVCIDTPPSLGLLTINALTAADKVIVPVQCEYLSMRGLIQLQNTLSMIREELNPDVEIEGILPTLVDSRTVHAKEAIEILEENFGDRVFATRIRKTIRFAEAPVKGTSVLKYDPDGVAAESYRELAKEVLANGRR